MSFAVLEVHIFDSAARSFLDDNPSYNFTSVDAIRLYRIVRLIVILKVLLICFRFEERRPNPICE